MISDFKHIARSLSVLVIFLWGMGLPNRCGAQDVNSSLKQSVPISKQDIKKLLSVQTGGNFPRKSFVYENFFKQQNSYIPVGGKVTPQTVTTELKIRFVIIEKNNTGVDQTNFRIGDTADLHLMVTWLNLMFATLAQPTRPVSGVCGSCYIKDERIRLGLTEIDFVDDSMTYRNPQNTYLLNRRGRDKDRILNIYLYADSNSYLAQYRPAFFSGGAWSNFGGALLGPSSKTELGIFMMNTYLTEKTYPKYDSRTTEHGILWSETMRLFHELHHVFGLGHLQKDRGTNHGFDPGGCSGSDFLEDAFPDGCPMSYDDHTTNNIMNSVGWSNYLSPMQIGRVHRSTFLGIVSKYCYPTEAPGLHPWIINQDQTWDFPIRMFQNIIVKKGVTFIVSGEIQMPEGSSITVEKGGSLIINGGLITSYNEAATWNGVNLYHKKNQKATLTLIEGGQIERVGAR